MLANRKAAAEKKAAEEAAAAQKAVEDKKAAEEAAAKKKAAKEEAAKKAAEEAAIKKVADDAAAAKAAEKAAADRALQRVPTLLKEGALDEAVAQGREALRLQRKVAGNDEVAIVVLKAKSLLGQALVRKGNVSEGLPLLRETLAAHVAASRHGDRLRVANSLTHAYRSTGMIKEAEELLKETIYACRAKEGENAAHTLHFVFQLGNLLSTEENRLEEAEFTLREAVKGLNQAFGADKEDTLNATGALAMLLRKRKKEKEAEPLLVDTLERARSKLGQEHRITLSILNNLGVMWSSAGKLEDSEGLYREALATKRHVFGDKHISTLNTIHNLGTLLHRMQKDEESYVLLSEEYNSRKEVQGPKERDTLKVMCALGRVAADKGSAKEGELLLKECLDLSVALYGSMPPDELIYQTAHDLAAVLTKAGRAKEAEPFTQLAEKHSEPDVTEEELMARRSIVD